MINTTRIKYLLKLFIPPVFFKLKNTIKSQYTFEGVYDHLNNVPEINNGYHNLDWVDTIFNSAQEDLLSIEGQDTLPQPIPGPQHEQFMPFLLSLLGKKTKPIILDIGGGMAVGYRNCVKYSNTKNFEYHVVETEELYEKSRKFFENFSDIFMHKVIPETLKNIDIVNIGSSLQYILGYKELLKSLTKKAPKYILLTTSVSLIA
jgi:putative methyltransferase (TIGR04325 family)